MIDCGLRGGRTAKRIEQLKRKLQQEGIGLVKDFRAIEALLTEHAGRSDFVKILDFGVAKLTVPAHQLHLRETADG